MGGGAGPAPSSGGRERETLRGGSGGRERQLSGYRGPSCTCHPVEDEEAAGAVTVSPRNRIAGTEGSPAWPPRPSPASLPLCWAVYSGRSGLGTVPNCFLVCLQAHSPRAVVVRRG
ncbi:ras-related protein Rab-9B isoform X2 [Odocoileus virginianus]|uniref:Ras-related protein Rab-9B isoform X2 n=1 Tax=Odocoileus virginianus TaxID=9874 RepID=A0ABM4HU90_ODOVR